MASVNSSTDIQSKPAPNFAFSVPGSNSGTIDSDDLADSLFANMLQNQAPPVNPPNPSATNNQQAAAPQNDGTANDINNNSNSNSNNSNSTNPAGLTQSHVPAVKPNFLTAGKSSHSHGKKNSGSKDTSTDHSDNVAANSPPSASSSNKPAAATKTNNNPPNANDQNDANADPAADASNASPNVNAASAPTVGSSNPATANLDATLSAAQNATTTPSDATDPNQAPATPAELATDIVAMLTAASTTAGTNPAATDSASTTPSTNDATATSAPGNTTADLLSLLAELEQLTASHAAIAAPLIANANAGQNSSTTPASATAGADPQNKIDLKALLAAIADLSGGGGGTDNTSTALNPLNGTAASSPAAASTANSAPATGNGNSSNTNNNLLGPAFLNLFGVPTNTNPAATLPVFNPGAVTNAMIANDGGTSLGADTQDQSNGDARSAAGLPVADSLLPTAPPVQAASPYDFASQLSAMRATQGGATGLPAPVDQVILQLSRGLTKDGSSQMTIQLKPAELGRVDVKLNIDSNGKVQGTVTADNPATLNLLLKDVRGLERALQEAGLRADSGSLQFGLRGDGQAGNGSGQTANSQSGFTGNSSTSDSSTILPAYANTVETYYLTPGGVNMRV